jgi:NTE family protein
MRAQQGSVAPGSVTPALTGNAKSVSLVLGSGGARGLAHIGVIQWLLENGYQIESISGTSIGALVGGIYATHKLDIYAQWVLALERKHVLRLLDPTIGRPGLFKGERIISVLRDLIGDHDIEKLPIAFTAVATDLTSREEVWLREGKLFDAIRASIATPLVFTPFKHGDRTLLDGALVNPVPIAPTLKDTTDLTVVVDLSGPEQIDVHPHLSHMAASEGGYRKRISKFVDGLKPARVIAKPQHGLVDVAFASMQAMQDTISQLRMAGQSPDVKIEIPRNACGFFEFWRAEELIALGREHAEQTFKRFSPADSLTA